MRRYGTLIISFICSVVIFIVLIIVQKQMLKQENIIEAYVLKDNVESYKNITIDMLKPIKISGIEEISHNIFTQVEILPNLVLNKNITKGKILFVEDLINKSDIQNYIDSNYKQKVIIPIDNVDNSISSIIHENSYINIYVTVDKEYIPKDFAQYQQITMDNSKTVTFLYLEKVKPTNFLNDKGAKVSKEESAKSVVVELNKMQAMYINYIKGKAGFNITAI